MDYGFILKKLISALVLPPGVFAVWFLFAALIARRRRNLGLTLVSVGAAAFLLLTLPLVATRLQGPLEAEIPPWGEGASNEPADRAGAIVILGGGSIRGALEYGATGGETLKGYTLRRVRYGARLAKETGLPILVSGGLPAGAKYAEADLMDEALRVDFGSSARWLENLSRDTYENAQYAVPMLRQDGITAVILVTDITHMARSIREFEARGVHVTPAATNYQATGPISWMSFLPSISAFDLSCDLSYEWLGRQWQKLPFAGRAE